MTRVVVIGAGLLGSAVADELAGRSVETIVLEAVAPAAGTSGSSFSWINAQDKAPAPYFELNMAGMRAYRGLADSLGGAWYHPGGDIAIGRGPGAAKMRERIERHKAAGYAVRELNDGDLGELEPDIDLGEYEDLATAHFVDEAWVDAPALIERRLARARARGAEIRSGTRVTGFEVTGGRVAAVRTTDGDVAADAVLVAAGSATQALAAELGVAVPMAPSPGLLVTVRAEAGGPRHIVHAGDVSMRPDGDGRVLVASRAVDAGLDPAVRELSPDAGPVQDLLARAAALVPALRDTAVDRVRVGVRSVSTDGMPVAGFTPPVENLYVLVTHSGATLAPVLGELVAAELSGEAQDQLRAYRPDRFA